MATKTWKRRASIAILCFPLIVGVTIARQSADAAGSVTPGGLWWTVDTAAPINAVNLSSIQSWYQGGTPKVWGRYLSDLGSSDITASEISFAYAHQIYIFFLAADLNDSNGPVCGNDKTAAEADADATRAITAAAHLGLPRGITIYKDLEQTTCAGEPSGTYMGAWYQTMAQSKYRTGFYGNSYSQSNQFPNAYCSASASIGGFARSVFLDAAEPEPAYGAAKGTQGPGNAPAWGPAKPSCSSGGNTVIWQYGEPGSQAGDIADVDEVSPLTPGLLAPNGRATFVGGTVSDVSGDGYGDILAVKNDGSLSYYPNNINGNPSYPFAAGYPYNPIGNGWQDFVHFGAGDVSGDGYSDILGVKSNGELWYYPNNINSNAVHPFAAGYPSNPIGSGWQDFVHFGVGDVSGDGYADILGVKSNGELWYYPNGMNSNSAHPFAAGYASNPIGSGWQDYVQFAVGDVSGDGYADILAVKNDGTLWYFPNNISSNPTRPFASGYVYNPVGSGWQDFVHVALTDVSGDGYADILAVKNNGELWYFPNNINGNSAHPFSAGYPTNPIGSGWQDYNLFINQ